MFHLIQWDPESLESLFLWQDRTEEADREIMLPPEQQCQIQSAASLLVLPVLAVIAPFLGVYGPNWHIQVFLSRLSFFDYCIFRSRTIDFLSSRQEFSSVKLPVDVFQDKLFFYGQIFLLQRAFT